MMIRLLCAAALTAFPLVALATEVAPCPVLPPIAQETDRMGVHGLALYGEPALPSDFKAFPYVNANAPKGGSVRLAGFGSFDNLNPFILKGEAADNLSLLFDTLLTPSEDEALSEYGLLAETVDLPADRSWVAFTLRDAARFNDGSPVRASDVVWTFNTLKNRGNPYYRSYYADVTHAEALSERKVKFIFKGPGNRELPLIIGQLPVLSEASWKDRDFSATTLTAVVGSGPYRIKDVQQGRSIVYERRADYWGKELPVNIGRYNFDQIRIDYYRDENVMMEAFKAGDVDFRAERVARLWATGYDFPAVQDGRVVKEEIRHQNPQGMQGFIFNTRRDVFRDVRVRKALAWLLDFEWMNANLFHGQYTRSTSYFSNSELASRGTPKCAELDLLTPLKDKLLPEIFTTPFALPVTKGDGNIREQLMQSNELLKAAGYTLKNGVMTNSTTGQPLAFEVLMVDSAMERVVQPYLRNLERLGIKARIRMVDSAQYQARINAHDFDMIAGGLAQSLSPGNEQLSYWGSAMADEPGSMNLAGIKDPAVDSLVQSIITAPDRARLVAAVRALDRVLLAGWYVVPNWHLSSYRVAYWNRFGHPANPARYSLGWPDNWWVDPVKASAFEKR